MFKDNKFKKEDNQRNRSIGIDVTCGDSKKDKYLKSLKDTRNFSYDKFNKGKLWYESGLSLEDADKNLRDDITFIRGYDHAKRLAYINDISNVNKKK